MRSVFLIAIAVASAVAADDPAVRRKAQALFKPVPVSAPALKSNQATPEKVDLGKLLFFDPRLPRAG